MKLLILCSAALINVIGTLEAATVRAPGVAVDVGRPRGYYYYYDNPSYQGWAGPGWYYGYWFDTPDTYYYWLNSGFNGVTWDGPGNYYGIYFDNEDGFNEYRRSHRFYGRSNAMGHPSYHKKKKRGKWDSKDHRKSGDK